MVRDSSIGDRNNHNARCYCILDISLWVLYSFLQLEQSEQISSYQFLYFMSMGWLCLMVWWCGGNNPGLLCRRSGVRFPDPPILGIALMASDYATLL